MKSVQTAPMPPAVPAALPFEASTNSNELENPLPPAVEEPEAPLLDLIPDEEEGIIQTLDSASIKTEEPEEAEEEITIKPKRDEASILETAATSLESSTPTSAGTSVMDRRTKMLTLTARPVQSHRGIQATESEQIEMRQVTHKRHFRQQNALRPLHRQFRNGPLEHTAEIPAPVKFKPLPVLPTSSSKQESVDTTTGAAAFRRTPVPQNQEQSSGTLQESSAFEREGDSETGAGSVIKIGRLPILKAESSPSASISSLKNFTNVRDHGARFHDDQHSRERAILATQTAEPLAEKISDAGDDLSIQR
jgi:hypothetical protein